MRHIIYKWFQSPSSSTCSSSFVVEATNGIIASQNRNAFHQMKRCMRYANGLFFFFSTFFFMFFSSSSHFIWFIRYQWPIENEQPKNRYHATFISWATHWIILILYGEPPFWICLAKCSSWHRFTSSRSLPCMLFILFYIEFWASLVTYSI